MSIDVRVDHGRRLVLVRGHGTVGLEEMIRYQRDTWSQPEVTGYDELVDMSDVREALQPTAERMRELATLAAGQDESGAGGAKLAIVAPQQELFGLARMYQTYRSLVPRSTKAVAVFHDLAEAERWLEGRGSDAGGPTPPSRGGS